MDDETRPIRTDSQKAYDEHIANILESQFRIKKWFNGAARKNDATWGDVGDVTEVDTQLKTVLEFIKSIPQG